MKTSSLKLLSLVVALFAHNVFSAGSGLPRDEYYQNSLDLLAQRGGVSGQALEKFWESLKLSLQEPARSGAEACLDGFRDHQESREELLDCLGSFSLAGFSPDLGQALFRARIERLQGAPELERIQSSALLGFLEDLVREHLRAQGHPAVWLDTQRGYLKGNQKMDFKFEDGDVVIGLGNSSLSSLISQITNVPSRYSHAFIVRMRNGQFTSIESLVQTGVRSFPLDHFLKDPYNQLTVLRWKDRATAKKVTAMASDWAQQVADRQAEYDMEMDFSEDEKNIL